MDTSKFFLRQQQNGFILGQDFFNIIIKDVYYHNHAKKYLVFGLIDDVNYNGNDTYKVRIDILKGDSVVYSTFSSQNGVFGISMAEGEKARFVSDLYIDLIIK